MKRQNKTASIKPGSKFGRLTTVRLKRLPGVDAVTWLSSCECGETTIVRAYALLSGNTRSCGCLKHESVMEHAHRFMPQDRIDALAGRTYQEVADELGIAKFTLVDRFKTGWPPEIAVTYPKGKHCPKHLRWTSQKAPKYAPASKSFWKDHDDQKTTDS